MDVGGFGPIVDSAGLGSVHRLAGWMLVQILDAVNNSAQPCVNLFLFAVGSHPSLHPLGWAPPPYV